MSPSSDFRYKSPQGNGLGYPYAYGARGIFKDITEPNYKPYHSMDQLPDEWENKDGHFQVAYITDPKTKYLVSR